VTVVVEKYKNERVLEILSFIYLTKLFSRKTGNLLRTVQGDDVSETAIPGVRIRHAAASE